MTHRTLVLNAGSSSLKVSLYARPDATAPWQLDARGVVQGIETAPTLRWTAADATPEEHVLGSGVHDTRTALTAMTDWLDRRWSTGELLGVGHRVVHGGTVFPGPTIVDGGVLDALRALAPLAPLHQWQNIAAIEAIADALPGVPQVACFDTSFHRGKPAVAELVPLPKAVRDAGVQRYGFHGLSCEYVASILPRVAPALADARVIVAHLGSGASMCAMRGGRSVDTSFGFTAADGLCMSTRPGSVDPGVVLYLFQALRLSVREVEDVLYRRSGLLGISGTSSDMRELLRSTAPAARLAVDYFVYRAAKELGALSAALGGLDGLVFTGGIGEHSPEIRRRIAESSAWLGLDLDAAANEAHGPCISRGGSRVSAWVVPADEELMIARHTWRLLGLQDR
jgi:acetate kinase